MKIFYDYQAFIDVYSGASKSLIEVGKILSKNVELDFGCLVTNNYYLNEFKKNQFKPFFPNFDFKGKHRLETTINQLYSTKKIKNNKFDVLHVTGELSYFKSILKKPYVITIHDMIPENFLKDKKRIQRRRELINHSTRIIAVSNNTKKELIELYPNISEDKIDVIYHGFNSENIVYKKVNYDPYILFVGKRESYKNFSFTLNSLLPLLHENKEINFICTGNAFTEEEKQFIEKNNLNGRVFAIAADEITLNSLYRNALVFIYPSLYEGFGIPILEAFGNQCPIAISNISCFPEIAGNAAEYFNPNDSDSILQSVSKIIFDKNYADDLKAKGDIQLKKYSWNKSAIEHEKVYKNICL